MTEKMTKRSLIAAMSDLADDAFLFVQHGDEQYDFVIGFERASIVGGAPGWSGVIRIEGGEAEEDD